MKQLIKIVLLVFIIGGCSKRNAGYIATIQNLRVQKHQTLIEGEGAPLTENEVRFLHYFPTDVKYKCECAFAVEDQHKVVEMPTYAGTTTTYRIFGRASCKVKKDSITLLIYEPMNLTPLYKGRLFLPFKDATNGESSYGGGRYIDLFEKDIKNGMLMIDFNMAYNPLCAYKDGYRCPIPPRENHLNISIEAGEKNFLN